MKNRNKFLRLPLLLMVVLLGFTFGCEKEKPPVLSTTEVTEITVNSAQTGGSIIDDSGNTIIARGVCWSTNVNPTINDSKTQDGAGAGAFTSSIAGLEPNTTYYLRAYATSNAGTGYGMTMSFITKKHLVISTTEIAEIKLTSAISGGNINDDSGITMIERGVCWSTNQNPTINDNKTVDGTGTGTGSFSSKLSGLTANTTYYVRAYATNSNNTFYGAQTSFKTQQATFTDTRDGNVYKTIQLGNQIWMVENLKYLPEVVGPATGSTTTSYYYVYGYDGTSVNDAKLTTNYQAYGVLYNWNAAMGACPEGWHLPSDAEWSQLENYLADNGYNYDGTTSGGRGKIAKSLASSSDWIASLGKGAVGNTDYPAYRNKSEFTALPGGNRFFNGVFRDIGSYGYWWSSTTSGYSPVQRDMSSYASNVGRSSFSKDVGYSVRCIRD